MWAEDAGREAASLGEERDEGEVRGGVNAPRVTVLLLEPPATVITNVVYRVGGLKQAFSNACKQLSRHILSEIAVTDVHCPQYSAYAKPPRR